MSETFKTFHELAEAHERNVNSFIALGPAITFEVEE